MYGELGTSSSTFNYLVTGFDNNTTYKVQAKGLTIGGTELATDIIPFTIKYEYPSNFTNLEVENMCEDGYNKLTSNIVNLNGNTTPNPPSYIDNSKLNLLDITQEQKVYWIEKSIINEDFAMQIWYEVGLEGQQFKLISANNENTYMVGELVREIPYARTRPWDYVQVTGYVDGVESFYIRSNYVELVNNTSYLILNFKYAPSADTYELTLNVYNQETNFISWKHYTAIIDQLVTSNGEYITDDRDRILGGVKGYELDITFDELPIVTHNNENIVDDVDRNIIARIHGDYTNTEYNRLTDVQYGNDLDIVGEYKPNNFGTTTEFFPIGTVELSNGIYDNIEIYRDYDRQYTTDIPQWSFGTLLLCNFNGNISGGSIQEAIDNIQAVKVMARKKGEFNYITLAEKNVDEAEDLSFVLYDYRVPNGVTMEYALVTIQNGGIDGAYITNELETKWQKLFVSDNTMTLSLIGNVSYGEITKNAPKGILQPINSPYPITIGNSAINYYSGSVSGTLMCENYWEINRDELVKLRETWCDFLTNGQAKVIKDWNGNIFIGQIVDQPSVSLNQTLGNSIGNISFNFVEQGKWDNQEDLYENGIVDVLR